jgi:hypothetical protein
MEWRPGGTAGGGAWILTLHGKNAQVRLQDNHLNALDDLYVAKVASPSTWEDFDSPGELRPDAFWKLVALIGGSAASAL